MYINGYRLLKIGPNKYSDRGRFVVAIKCVSLKRPSPELCF